MPTLLALNLTLFQHLNAPAGLSGAGLWGAAFLAEALIAAAPLVLAAGWLRGRAGDRRAVVGALAAVALGGLSSTVLSLLLPMPRPFMMGIGHTYLVHAADPSFPSDHVTLLATPGFALLRAPGALVRRGGAGLLLAAALTGWARVYLGVHFPLDVAGGFAVAACCAAVTMAAFARPLLAAATAHAERLYRHLLAYPIARGWLNP
jgi:undecaprenyl-diphosphatase